jgi:hypothetical protein
MSEEAFHFLTILLILLIAFDLILKWFYSPDVYSFGLFWIKPLMFIRI